MWWQWSGLAGLLGGGLWLWKKGTRSMKAAALLFLGPLLPVIGFLNLNGMRFAWVADRWVYFSMPVFCAVAAWWLAKLSRRGRIVAGGIIVVACSMLTWRQAALYDSPETFWLTAIRGNPHPVVGHSAYGEFLMHEGRLDEARSQFEQALKLEPDNAAFHCNLGSLLDLQREHEQALACFKRAIERDGGDPLFHYNHGFMLYKLGRGAEAENSFRAAIRLQPEFFAAHHDLGNLLSALGHLEEAEEELRQAALLRPTDAKATASLGNLRYRQGRKAEALELFEKALRLMPDDMTVLSNMARILATSADASLRDGARAVELAERAVTQGGSNEVGVLSTLAAAYAEAGRFDEAVKTSRNALQLAEQARMADGVLHSLRLTLQVVEAGQPVRAAER
jgi:Flp pilus assembly protein TadD